jgi:hypothetical protein
VIFCEILLLASGFTGRCEGVNDHDLPTLVGSNASPDCKGIVNKIDEPADGAINAADTAALLPALLRLRPAIVSLCDTPGFMVRPQAETTALVRHVSRMFTAVRRLSVPFFTTVLRKGYGLRAQAMAGGHFHAPFFTVAWPTATSSAG